MTTRKITVELAEGISNWAHGDSDLRIDAGGRHELDLTGQGDVRDALAAAVSAGVLVLHEGELPDSVESQEDSEGKYQRAQEAVAPLFEQRDRALRGARRLPEVIVKPRAEVEELAVESGTHAALLAAAPEDAQEIHVPARSRDDFEQLAEQGSEFHRVLLEWDDRMAQAAQEALEG
jgi:hypothetical protein